MAFNLENGTWFKEACAEQQYLVFDPRYVKEASKYNIQFGTADFIVYQYLRWCEDSGKYRMMVAGYDHIKERFGFDKTEDVRNVFNHLSKLGAVNHVWSDVKIYRAKTQVWVSTERMKTVDPSTLTVDPSTLTVDPSTLTVDPSTQAFPVETGVGNNNIKEKEEESSRLCSMNPQLSSLVDKKEVVAPPDFSNVVDVKKVKQKNGGVDGKTVAALLAESGKQGAVTASLIRLVRVQAEKYGIETLFEVARKSKFDNFYAPMGLQTLLAEKNIENILNNENKAEDPHHKSHSTGIRREI